MDGIPFSGPSIFSQKDIIGPLYVSQKDIIDTS